MLLYDDAVTGFPKFTCSFQLIDYILRNGLRQREIEPS